MLGRAALYLVAYALKDFSFRAHIHCTVQVLGMGTTLYYEVFWSEWGKVIFFLSG
jgi:hypothetical protein